MNSKPFISLLLLCVLCVSVVNPASAQEQLPSRVDIAWNRYHDHDGITDLLRRLVEAYPELLTLQSIGQSEQGRDMWVVTLNNPKTGADTEKPAMWIDANVHGNEVQGAEVVVYSIWYLTKSYGHVEKLTEMIDRTAFYFLPSQNPDGRDYWFHEANTSSSSRSGQRPTDNDYDGQLDEDGPEDIDGDGHIGRMWRFDPNGSFRRNRDDPKVFERVGPDEQGELTSVGSEGIDNDGDGRINEDGPGGYDMNRNWASDWKPNYIQYGAGDHPFDRAETNSIARFILAHPNIAAGQSYHNSGGMILRGPGASYLKDTYPRRDIAVYDKLGQAGAEMLPYYRYMVLYADLYTVHGGFVNWLAEGLGIIAFTNELWATGKILQNPDRPFDSDARAHWADRMLFGQTQTDYTEHDHPTLGKVLIGGSTKYASRVTPPFMLEEECHRNFAFTMFHAGHMPAISFDWIEVKSHGGDLWQITVEVANEKIIPSRTAIASKNKIGLPDRLSLVGEGVTVVTSGTLSDRFDRTIDPVKHRKNLIFHDSGISGQGRSVFRFLVTGAPGTTVTLDYVAQKARNIQISFPLESSIIEQ